VSAIEPLDILADFEKRYGKVIFERREKLRAIVEEQRSPTPESRAAYEELDSITNFEPELHRLIQAFITEALSLLLFGGADDQDLPPEFRKEKP
jgi:hypothetical protein